MPICQKCGIIFSSINGCPYCNQNSEEPLEHDDVIEQEFLQDNQDTQLIQSAQSSDPIPVREEFFYEPKNFVLCPNPRCGEKNERKYSHCRKCGTYLPIFDHKAEIKSQSQIFSQLLDPNVKKQYYQIGLHLYISKLIGKEKKMTCNGTLPSGQKCTQILTPLDKKCEKCGREHAFYPCVNCGTNIPISAMKCVCGVPSYLSDTMSVLNGDAMGEGAESIISDLENTFGTQLKKKAILAFVKHQDVIMSKFNLVRIARQLKENLDLLGDYLSDFATPSSNNQPRLEDSFNAMYNNNNQGIMQLNDIQNPIPSDSIQSLIRNRELEIQEENRTNDETPNNEDDAEDQNETTDDIDDAEDPWGDVNI